MKEISATSRVNRVKQFSGARSRRHRHRHRHRTRSPIPLGGLLNTNQRPRIETTLPDGKQEEEVGGWKTYGFADQVNYCVGVATRGSLLVSLILPLSVPCSRFLVSVLGFPSFLFVTLSPHYHVAFFLDFVSPSALTSFHLFLCNFRRYSPLSSHFFPYLTSFHFHFCCFLPLLGY